MGITLLAHAAMPLKFWDEAFQTVVFLINRLPSKVIDNDTPLHRLYKQEPDYSFLRTFGYAVWPNLRAYNTCKLQFRSKRCVFIGYRNSLKGFKCLDPSEGRIYISRDVVFDETVFPFSQLHANAGAQLRTELQVLPQILLNPSMSFGDAHIHDQHFTSSVPANVSSSSMFQSIEKTSTPNSACSSEHGDADQPYRMCPVPSGHTHANGDPPVDTTSIGSRSPSGSLRSPGVVPSTMIALMSSSTPAASPDPSAGEQLLDLATESG